MDKKIFWQNFSINRNNREQLHNHRSLVLWLTGLSSSGKSTIANNLEQNLFYKKINTYLLDGDNIRHGLCSDLDFSYNDRYENIRRIGEVAKLMFDAGLVVIVALISPYRHGRIMVRNMFPNNKFIEVFVDTPLEICKKRDLKNLYKQISSKKISNFNNINNIYESPEHPEIHLNGRLEVNNLVNTITSKINKLIIN